MELTTWTTASISTTPWGGPEMPQGQLEVGTVAFQGCLPSFLWVSFRLILTSFLPPNSRCENLRERNSWTLQESMLAWVRFARSRACEGAMCSSHLQWKCSQEKRNEGTGTGKGKETKQGCDFKQNSSFSLILRGALECKWCSKFVQIQGKFVALLYWPAGHWLKVTPFHMLLTLCTCLQMCESEASPVAQDRPQKRVTDASP